MQTVETPGTEERFRLHRRELVGYCYRMLGSAFDAEDAVQETHLRAWRSLERYDERRASWKTWLFSIATHVCIDTLRGAQRRMLATDMGPASDGGPVFGTGLSQSHWIQPVPDDSVLSGDPAEVAARKDTIRLAFVAALQYLPPRQRAVLILRDVLAWRAAEVADLLETTPASVNSALQRARATLDARSITAADTFSPGDPDQQRLLHGYIEAFENHDIPRLVDLLAEDAITSMPPVPWWMQGREAIGAMMESGDACRGDRMVLTAANGQPALAQYRQDGEVHRAFALVVVGIRDGQIAETVNYLNGGELFPVFGLPLIRRFPPPGDFVPQ